MEGKVDVSNHVLRQARLAGLISISEKDPYSYETLPGVWNDPYGIPGIFKDESV